MENAHHADDAIMAYREAVGKSIMAYREEIGKIIHAIPPQIFARLMELRPNARDVVLSVICNGRTFTTAWPAAPGRQRSSPAKQIDPREAIRQLDELHELLSGYLQPASTHALDCQQYFLAIGAHTDDDQQRDGGCLQAAPMRAMPVKPCVPG